jgi:hypothetical protein
MSQSDFPHNAAAVSNVVQPLHNTKTVAQQIALLVEARANCITSNNTEWLFKHTTALRAVIRECLPSGAGFDAGVEVVTEESGRLAYNGAWIDCHDGHATCSTREKLVFLTSFHRMDEDGGYNGWLDVSVVVTPTFAGVDVDLETRSPREENDEDLLAYMEEVLHTSLTALVPENVQKRLASDYFAD